MDVDRPQNLDKVERKYNSDAIADAIRSLGYPYVPLTPGSSYRGLHDSIVNYLGNTDPQMILCLHEEVAISVAHGYAKAAGTACPVLIHDLVGLMNGSMAVYNVFCDQVPVVIIGGGGPTDRGKTRRPIDNTHSAESQGELIREYVKWVDEPSSVDGAVTGIYKARQFAVSAPAGPTYVTIDVEMAERELATDFEAPGLENFKPHPPLATDPELVAEAVQLLANAALPVMVVRGRTSVNPAATPLLVELAETLGIAYHESSGSAFPTVHALNATTDKTVVADSDALLVIDGADASAPVGNAASIASGDRKLIELSSGDLHLKSWSNVFSNVYRRDVLLLSDPIVGLRALVAAAKSLVEGDAAARDSVAPRKAAIQTRVEKSRAEAQAAVKAHWDDPVISAGRFTSELWKTLRGTKFVYATRSARLWAEGIMEFEVAGQCIGSGPGGGIGYGPGAAVGVALAARDRGEIAVATVGDGDFLMANTALWTAVHYKLPLLLIVNDNHSFGNDEEHQQRVAKARNRPYENSWIGVHIDEPAIDFASMARSMGCHADGPITRPDDLKGALDAAVKAVQAGEVAVVHVVTGSPAV